MQNHNLDVSINKRNPLRTCVSCGLIRNKENLLRMVLSPEKEIVLDFPQKLGGRGVYLCPNYKCITKAMDEKKLKIKFNTDSLICLKGSDFYNYVTEFITNRVGNLIQTINKSGKLVLGYDKVLEKNNIFLILMTEDIKDKNKQNLMNKCLEKEIKYYIIPKNRQWLGSILNNNEITVIGILNQGLSNKLENELVFLQSILLTN